MLSIIIPSYKEPYLDKTIDSFFDNAVGEIEVIVVHDGYIPKDPIKNSQRVRQIYISKNVGMRETINTGVSYAEGKYLIRADAHIKMGEGYDKILTSTIKDDWIVTPRRYKLDPVTWDVIGTPIDYEKLVILGNRNKFASQTWRLRDIERADKMIDETMAMQGSFWCMTRKHWDKVIVKLDPKYGTHYQDSVEMVFKTWQAGGKLMLNKNTWFAHKHRKFKRTHNLKGKDSNASFAYALKVWGDYYRGTVLKKWL